ncbi:MAG: hypothetical protein R6U70_11410, partial [Bacillota bacterium]
MIRFIRISRPLMVLAVIAVGASIAAAWGLERVTEREVIHLWAPADAADLAPVLDAETGFYRSPWSLAVDASGCIYITDSARGAIHILHPEEEEPLRVQLGDSTCPSFPVSAEEYLYVYDQPRDELIRLLPGRSWVGAGQAAAVSLAEVLAGFIASAVGSEVGDHLGVDVLRLEGVDGGDLFTFADVITDTEIYRLAASWRASDPDPELVRWFYLARTAEEDAGAWTQILPHPAEEASAVRDAAPDGSLLRAGGGPFLWDVESAHVP